MRANEELRSEIEKNKLLYYQVAEQIGVSKYTLNTWLQTPINEARKQKVLSAIQELKLREAQ